MRVKIGDMVLVTRPEDTDELPFWDCEEMDQFHGKTYRVKDRDHDGFYLDECGPWCFGENWLTVQSSTWELDTIERDMADLFARMRAAIERLK